ncbi:MAG: YgiQ family radical SAM protein, partial [Bacteroidales bacterium]|nr:YgiQ family radical SAM protein [Bacteroidales bacterium]
YTPGGEAGFRPDYATYVYAKTLKKMFPDTPVVIGGIEASMRRLTHYDYWSDTLKPSILADTNADLLVYGMGEKVIVDIADTLNAGLPISHLHSRPQVGYITDKVPAAEQWETITLHSHEACQKDKFKQAQNFHHIELESNKIEAKRIVQPVGKQHIVINPPDTNFSQSDLDRSFELPYMRLPHPKYAKRGAIPAFEMIKFSVNTHRGCFGGCSFCTISAHQGKQVVSRSEDSILREVALLAERPDFHGVITDLGGPSANMYRMKGKNAELCRKCSRYSCIHPSHCKNLDSDHSPLIELCHKASAVPKVKHLFIGSGIRYDLFTNENNGYRYWEDVVRHHVSGRLKVAPEHTSDKVLQCMRKPSFRLFGDIKRRFDDICRKHGLNQQLIPYFISSHPGCRLRDMAELAITMKGMGYKLEQIQDFTPTPMTLATEMYYTGYNPATMEKVFVARHPNEKREQNRMFFWYKAENRNAIRQSLIKSHNEDLIRKLIGN